MAIGVASDKTTPVSIDSIAYYNRIMQIAEEPVALETEHDAFGEEHLLFTGFEYSRSTAYPGCFYGEVVVDGQLETEVGPWMGILFESDVSASGITGFAQWADDARRVNTYIHDAALVYAADLQGETGSAPCELPADPRGVSPPRGGAPHARGTPPFVTA